VYAAFGYPDAPAGMARVTVIGAPAPFTTSSIIPEPQLIASPPPAAATGVTTLPALVMVWVVSVAILPP
jgi:hypothetical protein